MVMVYVPAGEFLMGSADSDKDAENDEKPQHRIYLDAFWIDSTEVTNAMFARFVTATGYKTDAEKEGGGFIYTGSAWEYVNGADWRHPGGLATNITGLDNYPVVQVSWNDAQAYCQGASKALPTEAQWEKAARGTDGRLYPWGNQTATCAYAVMNDGSGNGCGQGAAAWAVKSRPRGVSPYGALDMAGNVWEWVIDWYDSQYYASSPSRNPTGPSSGATHVLRGGSWYGTATSVRAASRHAGAPDRVVNFGFRCAVVAP